EIDSYGFVLAMLYSLVTLLCFFQILRILFYRSPFSFSARSALTNCKARSTALPIWFLALDGVLGGAALDLLALLAVALDARADSARARPAPLPLDARQLGAVAAVQHVHLLGLVLLPDDLQGAR